MDNRQTSHALTPGFLSSWKQDFNQRILFLYGRNRQQTKPELPFPPLGSLVPHLLDLSFSICKMTR